MAVPENNNIIMLMVAIVLLFIIEILSVVQIIRRKRPPIGMITTILLIIGLLLLVPLTFRANDIKTAEWVQIILTIGLVAVTAVYAYYTEKMAQEMSKQRLDSARPVIDIVNRQKMPIELAREAYSNELPRYFPCDLQNVGVGPAIDVHSFVHDSGQEQRFDFGTLARDRKNSYTINLSVKEAFNRKAIVVYYQDVYGRWFESSREVRIGAVNPDPLKIREIPVKELPK